LGHTEPHWFITSANSRARSLTVVICMHLTLDTLEHTVLSQILQQHAAFDPERVAYTFLADGQSAAVHMTVGQLARRAAGVAAELHALELVGKPVLLLFRAGPEYLCALIGCFWAGAIAVPAYPPSNKHGGRVNVRIAQVIADAGAYVALTTQQLAESLSQVPELAGVRLHAVDMWFEATRGARVEPAHTAQAPCLLQYTSGSIAEPKGVVVSHAQLLANVRLMTQANRKIPRGPLATWLPPYHDMGLVGTLLWPVADGRPIVQMPPDAFIRRPIRWLRALSEYGATITAGPNFALELCVRRVTKDERRDLDLSQLQALFTGAEPVRAATLDAFAALYAAHGFRREAFAPCYGMAEATLFVTGRVDDSAGLVAPTIIACSTHELGREQARPARPGEAAQRIVGCGAALPDMTIRIVAASDHRVLEDGAVGEIWLQSACVASGYWQRPDATATTFGARTEPDHAGPFLRTGDLGFLSGGELFIMGRIKDVIIVRGIKHHAHDLEQTVQDLHPALVRDAGAAVSLEIDNAEQVCIVQEVDLREKPDTAALLQAIVHAVQTRHELALHTVVLIKRGSAHKTASGKIMRRALLAAFKDGSLPTVALWQTPTAQPLQPSAAHDQLQTDVHQVPSQRRIAAIEHFLRSQVAERAQLSPADVELSVPLANFGIDSVATIELAEALESWLGEPVPATLTADHPTIAAIARALVTQPGPAPRLRLPQTTPAPKARRGGADREAIAVVGMACRFPGARSLHEFWQLLQQGRHAITPTPASRAALSPTLRFGGFIDDIELFDAGFFGITPREAARMDPQQRLFLEVVWHALEDAGIAPARLRKSQAGVFAAVCGSDHALVHSADLQRVDADFGMGHSASVVANRVSYFLDLQGPSLAFDAACASSLVALHAATQSLLQDESELAIVGGVNAVLAPQPGLFLANARTLSQDGRCKAFDTSADGFVRSEGCGVVILKKLSQAVIDNDRIYALMVGSAIGHNGMSQGLMMPSVSAQTQVMRRALARARLDPSALDAIEAHGVGAPIADTQELRALGDLLRSAPRPKPCWLGSVKTNIGHLEAASGMASVIKAALSLHHEQIPGHLHLDSAHEALRQSARELAVPSATVAFPRNERPRYTGVSAFGMGGANAHVILAEAPPSAAATSALVTEATTERPSHVLCLSARSPAALTQLVHAYADHLAAPESPRNAPLADVCYTANTGRQHFRARAAFVASDLAELQIALARFAPSATTREQSSGRVGCAFGHLRPQPAATRVLYETQPVFAGAFETACEWLEAEHPDALAALRQTPLSAAAAAALSVATSYAQWSLLLSLNIAPDALYGAGAGEFLALSASGVLTWPTGIRLAYLRQLFDTPAATDSAAHLSSELARCRPSPAQTTLWLASRADSEPLTDGSLLSNTDLNLCLLAAESHEPDTHNLGLTQSEDRLWCTFGP
ncbi:MAG: hypothetical protein RL701_7445, partial [Pseudomonadota bacterium]